MTQLRCNRDSLSNIFDEWLRGIGHRGSSFCDIDAITHDETTHRYLIQEFKQAGEVVPDGQRRVLSDLAREPRVTVWIVRRLGADVLSWADALFWNDSDALISVAEYQDRFRAWWTRRYRVEDYAEISTDQFQRVEGRR